MIFKQSIDTNKTFYVVLVISLLFFLIKGINYLFIGSIIPIIIALFLLFIIVISFRSSEKKFRRAIRFWAILLIIWASVRVLLGIINAFIKPMHESHINEQMGIVGTIISLSGLCIGIYLIRKVKNIK